MKFHCSHDAKIFFAIDLDKTFYIEDPEKFRKNIECFKNLKSKNILPFFCTGRVYSSAMDLVGDEFVKETGYNGYPGVYANGAIVYDCDGNLISRTHFTQDFIEKFVKYLTDRGLEDLVIFKAENSFYILKDLRESFKDYPQKNNMYDLETVTFGKLLDKKIISINMDRIADLDELKENFCCKISINQKTYHLTPEGITKAYGFKKLLEHLGASSDKSSFVGDGDNDIEVLKYCKLSYAVGNADEVVKKAAKTVLVEHYDQGAFEKAVQLVSQY